MANRRGGRRAPATQHGREHERIAPSTSLHSDPSQVVTEPENASQTQLTPIEPTTDPESTKNTNVRGATVGKGARIAMMRAKDRLTVQFDFRLMKAICNNAEAFNNEIGYNVRNHCSLQYKEWRFVPETDRKAIRLKLLTIFDVDIEDEEIKKVIDSQMQKAWRNFRYKLHADYKRMDGENNPIRAKETGHKDISKADWEYLCDRWSDDTYKEQAKKNAESRAKRNWESRNGSKSTPRHHLSRGLELDSPTGQIETWKIRHYHPKNGWSSPAAAAKYEEMMLLRQDNPPENMTDKDILEKVLGKQSNRLFGWGRSPSKSQGILNEGSSRPTHAETFNELMEVKANCLEAHRQLKEVTANYDALKDQFDWIRNQLFDQNILSHSESSRSRADE